jgi:hypothetical protein
MVADRIRVQALSPGSPGCHLSAEVETKTMRGRTPPGVAAAPQATSFVALRTLKWHTRRVQLRGLSQLMYVVIALERPRLQMYSWAGKATPSWGQQGPALMHSCGR